MSLDILNTSLSLFILCCSPLVAGVSVAFIDADPIFEYSLHVSLFRRLFSLSTDFLTFMYCLSVSVIHNRGVLLTENVGPVSLHVWCSRPNWLLSLFLVYYAFKRFISDWWNGKVAVNLWILCWHYLVMYKPTRFNFLEWF